MVLFPMPSSDLKLWTGILQQLYTMTPGDKNEAARRLSGDVTCFSSSEKPKTTVADAPFSKTLLHAGLQQFASQPVGAPARIDLMLVFP
ncbi:hypothetical protein EYR38_008275 [Pleurotus pulmonarius]|nr:hypothetical protein EYR38_008275 [Pleurotus pulmonarius]